MSCVCHCTAAGPRYRRAALVRSLLVWSSSSLGFGPRPLRPTPAAPLANTALYQGSGRGLLRHFGGTFKLTWQQSGQSLTARS